MRVKGLMQEERKSTALAATRATGSPAKKKVCGMQGERAHRTYARGWSQMGVVSKFGCRCTYRRWVGGRDEVYQLAGQQKTSSCII